MCNAFLVSYLPRVTDDELLRRARRAGAVLIEGPKACGKTASAQQIAASTIQLDTDPSVEATMAVDPSLLLEGDTPRLLDEWQLQPRLWDHVRRAVDVRREPGQFILTGSSVPNEDVRSHSGAGRISRMRMRPMSLWESGASTGDISLEALLEGKPPRAKQPPITVPGIADAVIRGGWPASVNQDLDDARAYVTDYLSLLADVDMSRLSDQRRDPTRVRRLLQALARNTASEVTIKTLTADVAGTDLTMSRATTMEYLDALTRLMIVEEQPAWSTSLRSAARLRKTPKRHFVDPSLSAAALDTTSAGLLADLNTLGFLFESLVVRDLRIYSQASGGKVHHYRDSNGREADAIIQLPDGGWAAFEVKLGVGAVDKAAESLLLLAQDVDTSKIGEPRTLAVITGTGLGYRRKDGVNVVPIGSLKP